MLHEVDLWDDDAVPPPSDGCEEDETAESGDEGSHTSNEGEEEDEMSQD